MITSFITEDGGASCDGEELLPLNTSLLAPSALTNNSKADIMACCVVCMWKNLAFLLPVALLLSIPYFLITSV